MLAAEGAWLQQQQQHEPELHNQPAGSCSTSTSSGKLELNTVSWLCALWMTFCSP